MRYIIFPIALPVILLAFTGGSTKIHPNSSPINKSSGKAVFVPGDNTTFLITSWIAGQILFKAQCNSCHILGKDLTGPDLVRVESKWKDKKLLRLFIRDWKAAVVTGDPEAIAAANSKPTAMDQFLMSDKEIDHILYYIRVESRKY
jgi:cytochrome c2